MVRNFTAPYVGAGASSEAIVCAEKRKRIRGKTNLDPPAKRRKCVGEKVFDFLPRISSWDEIELNKVFKVKNWVQTIV